MANHPSQLSPRQRMINMMYLVLTALLALNISNEVLKAFVTVDKSLDKTTKNFSNKNLETYALFDQAATDNPVKAGPWRDKAYQIKNVSGEAYNFIQSVKDTLEILGNLNRDKDGWDERMSQREVHANLLINKGVGSQIKKKINDVRKKILEIVDSSNVQLRNQILDALSTEDNDNVSWESSHFENIALAPVFTYLTQFQSEIRNSESSAIDYLFQNIDAGAVKFNKLNATVIAPSNYVFSGDSFKADVFVTAFDTTQDPEVLIYRNYDSEGNPIGEPEPISVEGGIGKYNVPTGKEGYFTWGGVIRVKSDGGVNEYPFMNTYQVARPALVVSPTKMNILYRGVDNPVDISVPGVSPSDLSVSCSGCKISGRNGKYVATVSTGSKATINVAARGLNGKLKRIGNSEFRIGRIPPPEASIAGKTDGKISRNALKSAQGIGSFLRDFPFDIKYSVTEFTVRALDGQYVKTVKVKGNRFNSEVRNLVGTVKTGSDVSFTGIKARGPDGTKKCNPITLTVQ